MSSHDRAYNGKSIKRETKIKGKRRRSVEA